MHLLKSLLTLAALIFLPIFLPSALADNETIKIGVITPLSGGLAIIGTALKNGIELARSDRPELFKNITFIYEDDQFDPKQSLTAYRKLKEIDHVSVVLGFGAALGLVIGPLAGRDSLPLINFNFDASAAIGKKFVVRSMNHTGQYMMTLVNYLQKKSNSKFFIVQAESPFFNAMVKSFRDAIGENGTVEIVATYNPNDKDFKSTILKLRSTKDAPVGIFLFPDQLIDFLKQAKELHLEKQYFGTDLFETAAGMVPDPGSFQGCVYPDNQVSSLFRTNYHQKFGNEAQLAFAGSGYEMALLIGRLISEKKVLGSRNLIDAFAEVRNQTSVLGEYSFVNDEVFGKFFQFPVYVKKIVGSTGVPAD